MARELDYPPGQAWATTGLVIAALLRPTWRRPSGWPGKPGRSRTCPAPPLREHGYLLAVALAETGDLAAAEQAGAATLARDRDAGDLHCLGNS